VLGWEDAFAEAEQNIEAIDSVQSSVKTLKAKRQSKAVVRNSKSTPLFPMLVHGTRIVLKGKGFDKDTAPQTLTLSAATAEEARQWAIVINTAAQSLAHDVMSIGLQPGKSTFSARAVKLLVIEDGAPGQATVAGVRVGFAGFLCAPAGSKLVPHSRFTFAVVRAGCWRRCTRLAERKCQRTARQSRKYTRQTWSASSARRARESRR
jgi:hypothetical protein